MLFQRAVRRTSHVKGYGTVIQAESYREHRGHPAEMCTEYTGRSNKKAGVSGEESEPGREEETVKMSAKRQPLAKFSIRRLNIRQGHRAEHKTRPLPLSGLRSAGKTNQCGGRWLRAVTEVRRGIWELRVAPRPGTAFWHRRPRVKRQVGLKAGARRGLEEAADAKGAGGGQSRAAGELQRAGRVAGMSSG